MSKKRGLSLDEKRTKMLELFTEKKEIFQMKELEKIAPREKGIVSQSVKDVVQSLVDDGLVDTDKIGQFVCFWAFPSKAGATRQRRLDVATKSIVEIDTKIAKMNDALEKARSTADDPEERKRLQERMKELEEENAAKKKELEKYVRFDPATLDKVREETKMAVTAANRWTGAYNTDCPMLEELPCADNIYATKSWMKRKFGVDEKDIDGQFGIPEELDYLDDPE